jgi:uncharacterized protein
MTREGSAGQEGIGHASDLRDGIRIDWNVPIEVDDGLVLRGDVYRPPGAGQYPALLTYGPYAKGLAFQEGYAPQWEKMASEHPDVVAGSTGRYQNWEVADPEKWVPHGYACVRVDSRGAGCSPGVIDVWSPREARDLYECIEWAAAQPWCTGKVGLCGISYYAMNQWQVAGEQPPHLAAMVPWEGAADFYRDATRHGGILCDFVANWYPRQVESVQYGLGARAAKNPNTGEPVTGGETLTEDQLAQRRADLPAQVRQQPLDGRWYRDRSADWSRVTVPFLSAANWGGQGLHPRGNFEAFTQAASRQKWLEVHGLEHWTHFYTDYGIGLQRRFFDHFLKGVDNGWDRSAPVRLNIRRPGGRFTVREEQEWPLARTAWTRFYLDAATRSLAAQRPAGEAAVSYEAAAGGVTFELPALTRETEITGPAAAKLFVSSGTADADLFLIVRAFGPDGAEVTFQGALDPNTPIAQGWLRASHRRLDRDRTLAYRPYHTHDRREPLSPGEIYELDIEIWPTCIVLSPGYRLALSIRGTDYEYEGETSQFARSFHYANRGVGPFTHNDPADRPPGLFSGQVTLHTGGSRASYVLLPVIPSA